MGVQVKVRKPKQKGVYRGKVPKPSARELFAELHPKLLAWRPVDSIRDDGVRPRLVKYGKPTFRNIKEA